MTPSLARGVRQVGYGRESSATGAWVPCGASASGSRSVFVQFWRRTSCRIAERIRAGQSSQE